MAEKVAVFLDVENLSSWLKSDGGEKLLERASELGRVVVRRAYGNFSIGSVSARQTELNLLGFEFVHVFHPAKGKNSADIQIVVDVMEYITRIPDLEWVVLATGDSDFSPLFRRLRELGKSVVGVGPRSTLSEAVKKSCNRFIYINDENSSPEGSSVPLKTNQIREDALDLLERVLDKFPDGVSLSVLKNEMLEIDSAFDEKNLGFSGFMRFLQSAPEVVAISKDKKIWHAKSVETGIKNGSKVGIEESQIQKPTTDLYRRFLRKGNWRLFESSLLWDSLIELGNRFPEGFTKSEEFECLVSKFGREWTRGELRAVTFILYKSELVTYQEGEKDSSMLAINLPESERILSRKVDLATTCRLVKGCEIHKTPFIPELVAPLLHNSYTKEKFEGLIEKAQEIVKAKNQEK